MALANLDEDAVWKALADPTRRLILEALESGPANTGSLVERFSAQLVRTAVMKHLDVLEEAQLIRVERVGRSRRNHLDRKPLRRACAWLEERVNGHQQNLSRLRRLAEE